jgi:excinuclease ABC subunit A
VLVVEHDEDMIRAADHVMDMGPGAGVHGGRVIAQGTPDEVAANPDSADRPYLAHVHRGAHRRAARAPPAVPARRRRRHLRIVNARGNNLRGVTWRSRWAC